jgi:hypothetical protein
LSFPIFDISSDQEFEKIAFKIYQFQRANNIVYNKYCELLGSRKITSFSEIPFLPISFFKSHRIITQTGNSEIEFTSSGTTGSTTSSHFVTDLNVYNKSLDRSFELEYGLHTDYTILALLPHYLEREGSSLVYMTQRWIEKCKQPASGFYLNDLERLSKKLVSLKQVDKKVILIGVTFALLELAEKYPQSLENTIIIETGGMKGMRKEIIKPELHRILKNAFPEVQIHSEYGMTELLSQAYAKDGIYFNCPPWMKVLTRDTNDPLSLLKNNRTGGLNIIDLANYNSCSFIATQDLGKSHDDGTFEVLGRFDHSDIRGCNLMAVSN